MKTIKLTRTETTFVLPVREFLSTWQGTSNEQTRYYLNGVYCEQVTDCSQKGPVNMVATDGSLLIRHELDDDRIHMGSATPTQSTDERRGFILEVNPMEKALKVRSRNPLWMHGDTETGILQIFDTDPGEDEAGRIGVCEFSRIDGTFPAWERIVPADLGGCVPVSCDLQALDTVRKALTPFYDGKTVPIVMEADGHGRPIRLTSSKTPSFLGVLMPLRQ